MSYELFAHVYDRLMKDMPYDEWLEMITASWEHSGKPQNAVDLGCGTGKLTVPLAEMGVHMVGIDNSENMLSIAQNKSRSVQWLQQDMRDWELPEKVQAVYSFCDSLNYILEEQQMIEIFKHTYNALDEKGVFIFDMLSSYQYEQYQALQPHVWNEPDLAYIWTCDYDPIQAQIDHELTFFSKEPDGRFERWQENHQQRAYNPLWVKRILLEIGFKEVWLGSDFSWNAPHPETERFFVLAKVS